MRFDRFEIAALQLASRGVTLTVANVAAHLEMPLGQAEAHLDRMAREGRLEVEIDDRLGVLRYRPVGLDPATPVSSFAPIVPRRDLTPRPAGEKNVLLGALIALLVPGFGLFYAAPASVAIVAGLLAIVMGEAVQALPFIGGALGTVAHIALSVASAALAVLYVRQYNRYGHRTHLERLPLLPA